VPGDWRHSAAAAALRPMLSAKQPERPEAQLHFLI
jgi:hypothetical protein